MAVDINYWWLALIAIGVLLLIIWQVKRDQKDQKTFEKEIIKPELKHEKHDDEEDKNLTP